ncbi:hypothetical protein BSKO_08802 [Bryopsis sp. KO-2023]|nr:hypothetical protein BSKO_08802 [Bryopsis sp. KO-2023]
MTTLSMDEIETCRRAFASFDKDNSGTIDVKELQETLAALGQHPSEEDLFIMISQVDEDDSGVIEFPEFLRVIEKQKEALALSNDESDTIDAFVALGGNPDMTGEVSTEKLRQTIKEFELTIDMDALIKAADTNGTGMIEYKEFKTILQ